MKHLILLLCLTCLGAETNNLQTLEVGTNFLKDVVIIEQLPRAVEIYADKSPDPWLKLKLISTARKTNDWLTDYDYSATNMQITSTHKPTVTETNGKWIITFKP